MLSVAAKHGPDGQLQLHASTVVIDGKAVVLVGPSGSGKSGHALALMSRGAQLLADDITWFTAAQGIVTAHCPPALSGRIEARGVGILNAVPARSAPVHLVVDLGMPEGDRLPPRRSVALLGQSIPLFHNPETVHFIDTISHYMKHGLAEDTPAHEDENGR